MGLINAVVPDPDLDAEVERWCDEINEKSPTAIAIAKRSFNADSENIRGIGHLAFSALALYFGTDEAKEGGAALSEKRKPDFHGKRYRGHEASPFPEFFRRMSMSSPTGGSRLLEGLVVIEIGTRFASTACGSLMADLGADVILVEDAARPRSMRALAAAGKRSITVDSREAEDRAFLLRLVDAADVVLLSSDTGGFEAEIWNRLRPECQIVCDLTAYGHSGPLAGIAHSEAVVQAMAAIADTTGRPEGLPTFAGAPLLDMETAVYALAAILTAALVRRRTGAGQRIDIALYDVA